MYHIGSHLFSLVVFFTRWIIRILNMRVRTGTIRMLQKQMYITFLINQYLILNNPTFLQILQLHKNHLLIIKLKNPLTFLRSHSKATQHQCLILGHPNHHESSQWDRQTDGQYLEPILPDAVSLYCIHCALLLAITSAHEDLIVVYPACSALAPSLFQIGNWLPSRVYNIVVLASS